MDYPHWDSGGLDILARYVKAFPDLGAKEQADFLQNNLAELFGVNWAPGPR
jgi:hypothetical protein